MAITINTGMVARQYGQNVSLDLRGYTNLDSARIRFRGRTSTDFQSSQQNESMADTTGIMFGIPNPEVPTGFTFQKIVHTLVFWNFEEHVINNLQLVIRDDGRGEWEKNVVSLGACNPSGGIFPKETFVVESTVVSTSDHTIFFAGTDPSNEYGQIDATSAVHYYQDLLTTNPQTTINGQTTILADVLDNYEVSAWQALNGLIVNQLNTVLFTMGESTWVDAEIEYVVSMKPSVETQTPTGVSYTVGTMKGLVNNFGGSATTCGFEYGLTTAYSTNVNKGTPTLNVAYTHDLTGLTSNQTYHYRAWATNTDGTSYGNDVELITPYPYLEAPERTTPATNSKITDIKPYFEFTLPENTDNTATKYHARIRFSEYIDMQDAITIESKDSQVTWELWSGSEWVAFPSGGVDPESKVRVMSINNLSFTTYYWDVASWDGIVYGENSTVWNFRIMLTADGLYLLLIEDVEYNAYSVSVIETANGQIGEIQFEVNNADGDTNALLNYGDVVQLAINDVYGNSEEFKGVIRSKTPRNYALSVSAVTGSGILAERRIKEDYTSQDIGLTVKDIIDTYCDPLTSVGVNTSTGIVAPITATDKSPLNVLEELRRQHGIMYFIDKDWDAQLYLPSVISSAYTTVSYGGDAIV